MFQNARSISSISNDPFPAPVSMQSMQAEEYQYFVCSFFKRNQTYFPRSAFVGSSCFKISPRIAESKKNITGDLLKKTKGQKAFLLKK